MTVKLIRRIGLDDHEVVGKWTEEDGFIELSDDLRLDEERYGEYTEELMVEEFDGPDIFAVPEATQKTLEGEL